MTMMDTEESLQRARSELEMIQAAYPDEITVLLRHDDNVDTTSTTNNVYDDDDVGRLHDNTFPFRFVLRLSNSASITMELIEGYPEDSAVQVTNFRSETPIDKVRIDQVVRSVRTAAQQCKDDGIEGAITCCSAALEVWRDTDTAIVNDDTATSTLQSFDNAIDDYDDDNDQPHPSTTGASALQSEATMCMARHTSATTKYEWISGKPLIDRKSVFQAHLCRIQSSEDVHEALLQLLQSSSKMSRATHHMHAWRIVSPLNNNNNGTGASGGRHGNRTVASIIQHDNDDDGEDGAGSKLGYLLEMRQDDGVLVVVSRWYGGVHLGPKRFAHIVNVARELLVQNTTANAGSSSTGRINTSNGASITSKGNKKKG
jgi:putative IMPACT (imprinted ancient) family translation regulator